MPADDRRPGLAPTGRRPTRFFFALKASSTGYNVGYWMPLSEEPRQRVLERVRFEYRVLSSTAVFVGRDCGPAESTSIAVATDKPGFVGGLGTVSRRIEVVEPLSEGRLARGDNLVLHGIPAPFVPVDDVDRDLIFAVAGPPPIRDSERSVRAIYPAKWRDVVRTVLSQRDTFPLWPHRSSEDSPGLVREVIYRGPIDTAFDLLRSENHAAVYLGKRTLIQRRGEAQAKLVAAIEPDLFRVAPEQRDFELLARRIETLGKMEVGRTDGDTGRLVRRWIDHIAAHPGEPPPILERDGWAGNHPADRRDVNRALAWLLGALDLQEAARTFGPRLRELRTTAPGRWKDEVQAALEATAIEAALDLQEARKASDHLRPRTMPKASRAEGSITALRFSRDGRRLFALTGGEFVEWETDTLTLLRRRTSAAYSAERFVDERSSTIWFRTRPTAKPVGEHRLGDPETRQVSPTWSMYEHGQVLYADPTDIVTLEREPSDTVRHVVWRSASSGGIQTRVPLQGEARDFVTCPEERSVWGIGGLGGDPRGVSALPIVRIDVAKRAVTRVGALSPGHWSNEDFGVVPGGRYLCIGLRLFDRNTLAPVGLPPLDRSPKTVVISHAGGLSAEVVEPNRRISLWPEVPCFVRIRQIPSGRVTLALPGVSRITALAFAPDDGRLAVAYDDSRLEVWPLK